MNLQRSIVLLTAALAATSCGGDDSGTNPPPVTTQTLASIRLTTASFTVNAGASLTLTPQALDASGSVIPGVTGYTYVSTDEAVAESRGAGTFLAVQAGTAQLIVSLTRDGVTATDTADATVSGMLPATATVTAGDNANTFTPQTLVVALNANVTYSFGSRVHNVTYGSTAGAPTNIPNTSNADVDRMYTTVGDFSYDCTLHAGMTGEVLVR